MDESKLPHVDDRQAQHARFIAFVRASQPEVLGDVLERQASRIRDLETNVDAYTQLAYAALENVAQLTARNRQLARRIDALSARIRDLLGIDAAERVA